MTASQVFGVPINKINDDLRRKAKAINFGIIMVLPIWVSKTNFSYKPGGAGLY